jgi:hypothetical protein
MYIHTQEKVVICVTCREKTGRDNDDGRGEEERRWREI